MKAALGKFPNDPPRPYMERAEGMYLFPEDGGKIMDMSGGWNSPSVLGYSHPEVLSAMREQMDRFCHMDHDLWRHRQRDELAELLLSRAPKGLNRVYFAGNSGSEAVEAAMKLSYQVHWDEGKRGKTWYISREQSYHGATLQAMSMSERNILEFYGPIFPPHRARIPQHHPLYHRKDDESLDDYAHRGAGDLEKKILEIGPEKVCAFIGETMLGGLVGDVPPAPNYWKYVKAVCDKYDVHLILDEVYCGLGRSGKVYCCEWDDVTPDFVVVGKALAAAYVPLSAVVLNDSVEKIIAKGQGRIQHGHTHQGHSLGVAAALAVQRVVHREETLAHINAMGDYMRTRLAGELGEHPFYHDLRGRGLAFSLEYECPQQHQFGLAFHRALMEKHSILISAKWHRICFTPAYVITREQADQAIDAVVDTFKQVSENWDG